MLKTLRVALAALIATAGAVVMAPQASADVDVYSTPGTHIVNGREWRTSCEPYSVTSRCRTEIKATVVSYTGGKFVQTNGWAFNNLTYLPSPRQSWAGNPLAEHNMDGFVSAGRNWRTECDTATTGRGGCRSYIQADVIAKTASGFQWQKQWIFNSMVRFSAGTAPTPTTPPTTPPVTDQIAAGEAPAIAGWDVEAVEGIVFYTKTEGTREALIVVQATGPVEGGAQFFAEDMTNVEPLGSRGYCGTISDADGSFEVCAFDAAKYGVVLTFGESTTNVELHAVTQALMVAWK